MELFEYRDVPTNIGNEVLKSVGVATN